MSSKPVNHILSLRHTRTQTLSTHVNGERRTPPAFHLLAGLPSRRILTLQARMPYFINHTRGDPVMGLALTTPGVSQGATRQRSESLRRLLGLAIGRRRWRSATGGRRGDAGSGASGGGARTPWSPSWTRGMCADSTAGRMYVY